MEFLMCIALGVWVYFERKDRLELEKKVDAFINQPVKRQRAVVSKPEARKSK